MLFVLSSLCAEPFVHVSCPKSATFYMMRFLADIAERDLKYVGAFDAESSVPFQNRDDLMVTIHSQHILAPHVKVVLTYRDPRDGLVSFADYVAMETRKSNHMFLLKGPFPKSYLEMSMEERLLLILAEKQTNLYENGLKHTIRLMKELPKERPFLPIRFEDYIGPRGGGSEDARDDVFLQLALFLDLDKDLHEIRQAADSRWGYRDTFNQGVIGRWKTAFTEEIKEKFKAHPIYGPAVIQLGYEADENW